MMAANSNTSAFDEKDDSGEEEYVTVAVADQMFGLAIDQVHDVFIASSLTAVPLAPREIVGLLNLRGRVVTAVSLRRRLGLNDTAGAERRMAVGLENQGEAYGLLVEARLGLLNLRGRVVTAICLRRRLGLPDRAESMGEMAVGLEHQGESYGLLVDEVGEVMRLSPESREPNPAHMDERWLKLSRGVHRLDRKLLIILDVDAVLSFDVEARAA